MLYRSLLMVFLAGCVTQASVERETSLTGESKELFDRYKQFLTETQKDRFFAYKDDETRKQFVASLQIESRIAAYPKPVQDAIWQGRIIPGMDKAAVLLTWGAPHDSDYGNENGVQTDWWNYQRGSQKARVQFTQGIVTDVVEENQ
ncbi:MAG: hypothetical protein QM723_04130 [Myxococcaceae bacterium]